MKLVKAFFESIFENLGLVMAPMVSAVMTGLSVQHFFAGLFGPITAGIMGAVFGFSIEATGYMSFVAYQKDKDIKKPIGYMLTVAIIVTIIELAVFNDFQRWGIGLSGVAIAGIMYWSHSSKNATLSEVEELKELADLGYKKGKNGNLIPLRKASESNSDNAPKNTPKRISWKSLTPEAKQDAIALGLKGFRSKYGHVADSTFYGWLDRIEKEKSLNGAG